MVKPPHNPDLNIWIELYQETEAKCKNNQPVKCPTKIVNRYTEENCCCFKGEALHTEYRKHQNKEKDRFGVWEIGSIKRGQRISRN